MNFKIKGDRSKDVSVSPAFSQDLFVESLLATDNSSEINVNYGAKVFQYLEEQENLEEKDDDGSVKSTV